jgi:hypothetical protein
MTSYGPEQKGMDLAMDDLHKGSVMQTLGWVLLVFDSIPAVWIFVGFRTGSYFWLYWVVIEAAIGFGLLIAGTIFRSKAARDFSAAAGEGSARGAPGSRGAELRTGAPSQAEQGRRGGPPPEKAA